MKKGKPAKPQNNARAASRRTTRSRSSNTNTIAALFKEADSPRSQRSARARNRQAQPEVDPVKEFGLTADSTTEQLGEAILAQMPEKERVAHDKQLAAQTLDDEIDSEGGRIMIRPLFQIDQDLGKGDAQPLVPQAYNTLAVFSPAKKARCLERRDWDDFKEPRMIFFYHLNLTSITYVTHFFRTLADVAADVQTVLEGLAQTDSLSANDMTVRELTQTLVNTKNKFQHYLSVGREKISAALFSATLGKFTKDDAVDGNYEHYPEHGRYGHPVALGGTVKDFPAEEILTFCAIAEEKKTMIWKDWGEQFEIAERPPDNWETLVWDDMTASEEGVLFSHTIERLRKTKNVDKARADYAKELQDKGKAAPKVHRCARIITVQ